MAKRKINYKKRKTKFNNKKNEIENNCIPFSYKKKSTTKKDIKLNFKGKEVEFRLKSQDSEQPSAYHFEELLDNKYFEGPIILHTYLFPNSNKISMALGKQYLAFIINFTKNTDETITIDRKLMYKFGKKVIKSSKQFEKYLIKIGEEKTKIINEINEAYFSFENRN